MSRTYSAQLRKAILNRRARPSQQFGQKDDVRTDNGATGCTDTVLQWLIWLWTGKWHSHDAIRAAAGYPPASRGLYVDEVARVIKHFGLPYRVHCGSRKRTVNGQVIYPSLSAIDVAHASKLGPVGFGHRYSYWPDWKGYHLGGVASDGKPNGYARPLGHAGHTQKTWDGAHFGALLGYAPDPVGPDEYYGWEPNHNSPARPEKPPYDRMTYPQFERVYDSFHDHLGRFPLAIVPTKTLPAKGY